MGDFTEYKVLGVGGIGSVVAMLLAQRLSVQEQIRLTLIDGDKFEPRNQHRQLFYRQGENKALAAADTLMDLIDTVRFRSIQEYVGLDNVADLIQDGDVVFVCPDHDYWRRIVTEHALRLENIVLILGGNEETDGSAHIHVRKGGENLTPSLFEVEDEVAEAEPPEENLEGCDDTDDPQTIEVNAMTASCMMALYGKFLRNEFNVHTVYFDLLTGSMRGRGPDGEVEPF